MSSIRRGNNKRRGGGEEEDDLDITPMIDVTFLLLIFFMVTSTMQQNSLEIPPAKTGIGVPSDEAVIVSIFNDDGTPGIYLADAKREDGPVAAEQVKAYVEESGKSVVIIKSDRSIPFDAVEEVARSAAEVERVEQFYFAVQDK